MPVPIGPHLEGLLAEYSNTLERWFDRCQRAVETARNGNYSFEQFAADVSDTWVEGTSAALFPLGILGGVSVARKLPFPVVRFKLLSTNDTSRVIGVPNLPAGQIAAQNLQDASGGPDFIPSGGGTITLTRPTPTTIKVALAKLGNLNIPAGLYRGNIIHQGTNTAVARIEVDFP